MSVTRFRLRDGRVLEYLLASGEADGLLVLHLGTPCAVTAFRHVSSAAARRGLRTLVCSRPGYGASTRAPDRAVADTARDTAELIDHLGAESVFVAGWSGGGPAALACAALLPARVRACITLASPAPPAEAAGAWQEWYSREERAHRRGLLDRSADDLLPEYEQAAVSLMGMTAELLATHPANSASDLAALQEVPAASESLARSMRLGVSDGVWGWVDDDLAWARPWGFRVSDIRVPVIVRHGDEDRIVSVAQAHWLVEHIPTARLEELRGGGHTSVAAPFEPVIDSLLGAMRC
jgi:pimeloyl-ACP methyl ester carboxylesterase